jgi:YjbE family integral membrane protein
MDLFRFSITGARAAATIGRQSRKKQVMDFPSAAFQWALAAIVVIDLMLAGDNAIVITLVARTAPARLRRRAIAWGTLGAIGVRALMTFIVTWLLAIPGLLLASGAILVWIAYKLLVPRDPLAREGNDGAWTAARTLAVASLVMGIDNTLGVAGAAQGDALLLALGLVMSVPIIIWGAGPMMHLMSRFPAFVYVGAAVIAWTAVDMMLGDVLVQGAVAAAKPHRIALMYVLVSAGVVFAGLVRTHRRFKGYGMPAALGTAIALALLTMMD